MTFRRSRSGTNYESGRGRCGRPAVTAPVILSGALVEKKYESDSLGVSSGALITGISGSNRFRFAAMQHTRKTRDGHGNRSTSTYFTGYLTKTI